MKELDIFEENKFTQSFHLRYRDLNKIYNKLIEKAMAQSSDEKMIFFTYSGESSMSSELSNGLYFKNKDKFIVVAYRKQATANISIRGKNARKILLDAIKNIEGATGGGHEEACGARIPIDKLDEFKSNIHNLIS